MIQLPLTRLTELTELTRLTRLSRLTRLTRLSRLTRLTRLRLSQLRLIRPRKNLLRKRRTAVPQRLKWARLDRPSTRLSVNGRNC